MSKDRKKQFFSLPVDYALELIIESEEQISIGLGLLEDMLVENPGEKKITPIIIEILWSNFSMAKILEKEIENPVFHTHEDTQEDEYVLTEEIIQALQTLLLSRHYANIELNKFSYSMSLH